jgi:hypothetical protein
MAKPNPDATVHVLVGMVPVVPMIFRFSVGSGNTAAGAGMMTACLAIWGLGYWMALTTPPRRRSVNALLGLVAVFAGLIMPLVGFAVLAVVRSIRKSAKNRESLAAGRLEGPPGRKAAASEALPARERGEPILAPNMVDAELLPFLNRAGWSSNEKMASERLVAGYDNSPLVSLGWDSPHMVVIGDASLLTPQNKATALANLRKRPDRPHWEKASMDLPEGSADVFVRLGDVMTASDLWDPEFVRDALRLAGSDRVFFAVPTRESMVMATSPDPVARLAMARIQDHEHGEFVIGTEIIAFDGEDFVVMTPMVDRGQAPLH